MSNAKHSQYEPDTVMADGDPPFRLPLPRQDVLSQVLTLIRLRGEVVYRGELAVASGIAFPAGPAHFYFVQDGKMAILPPSSEPVELKRGDLVLLPRGDGHTIIDSVSSRSAGIERLGPRAFSMRTHLFCAVGAIPQVLCALSADRFFSTEIRWHRFCRCCLR